VDLDAAMEIAVHGAAGELQMEMHEIGVAHVSEADERRALRRALQMQLGPVVLPEGAKGFKLAGWTGRLLAPDVEIAQAGRPGYLGFAECKWCREDTVFETLWDLLKLAVALRGPHAQHGYLVVGAPAEPWGRGGLCAELIGDGSWPVRELLQRHRRALQWLLKGSQARPSQLPEIVQTALVAAVPMHLANTPDWELRAVRVVAPGDDWIALHDGWPVPAPGTQPPGGPPAF
jgi:hypothetical protein